MIPQWRKTLTGAILSWWHASSFFFLSKPRAVEVTCYQPAKVMAVAPVSTSSIYTTVPGTAVCAFAFVCVWVCVFWGMLRDLFHPLTPTSEQLCLGRDPELTGTATRDRKEHPLPQWLHYIFGVWNGCNGGKVGPISIRVGCSVSYTVLPKVLRHPLELYPLGLS